MLCDNLLGIGKGVDLKVNTEKTKYMLVSAGQIHHVDSM
jgi:hypothetical protein